MQTVKQQPKQNLNLIEKIQARFTEKLVNTPFPVERLSNAWKAAAFSALRKASPVSLGLGHNELAELHRRIGSGDMQLSFNQFAVLSNNMDTTSGYDLGLTSTAYAELLIEARTHIDFYGEQADAFKKQSEEEVAFENTDKPAAAFGSLKAEA